MLGTSSGRTRVAPIRSIVGAAVTLFVLSACSSGDPTPPASATPTQPVSSPTADAMTQTYTSAMLRYGISYPDGWTLTEATEPWVFGGEGDEVGDGTVDEFRSPGPSAFFVSSQEIPAGMTLGQWIPTYTGGGPYPNLACWPPPKTWEAIEIAGHPAKEHGGESTCNFTEAVTVADGRAYVFTATPNVEECCGTFDPELFDAFLASVSIPGDAAAS
jgi:hypothetical protein